MIAKLLSECMVLCFLRKSYATLKTVRCFIFKMALGRSCATFLVLERLPFIHPPFQLLLRISEPLAFAIYGLLSPAIGIMFHLFLSREIKIG
ncbi:hypothetical protein AVO45_13395 [Ruegeria marisrubri]|uniref:Uncharacterized protein n=1 Tax=Ruegeria marisrubri TaxID=1685379 RepID=A0A0X3TKI1_9RHOB|nr:hypothetical protein AVO45_13395 [Ruegeria marisrubri]